MLKDWNRLEQPSKEEMEQRLKKARARLEQQQILMKEKNPFNLDVVSVRLVKDAPIMSGHPITKPEDAVLLLGKHLCEMDREVLCVINMKTDGTPINCHFASIGCLNESMAHPREIFKASILSNAATIMLMHNHPSGNLTPSKHDTMMTDRMESFYGSSSIQAYIP